MNIIQLVKSHGYPILNYQVATEDGYKIELFRIPGPRFESPIESLNNVNLNKK